MAPPNISTVLATEADAPILASLMTAAFSTSDAAYPLIWGGAGDEVHDAVAVRGLFSPVQKERRLTFKAMDGEKMVGFATWDLPKPDAPKRKDRVAEEVNGTSGIKKSRDLPEIPGVNTELWGEKVDGPKEAHVRDVEESEDILLSLFFVQPEYQRQGIGSFLLQWGLKRADELKAKMWVTSTPQAVSAYEKNGWKTVQEYPVDLKKYGGEGTYIRYWMLREPNASDRNG